METRQPLSIYYDKSCPMCREEIHALKRIDHDNRMVLIDCSTENFSDSHTEAAGIKQEDMLLAMHVRDQDGNWYKAVDAFVQMYGAVGFNNISRMWANKQLRPMWDRLYPVVARNRHILSFFGLHRVASWLIHRSAKRAARRGKSCKV